MSGTPEGWESALIAAGFIDGRAGTGDRPSWRRLALAVGVHQTTLTHMRNGERETDQATVDKVAEALHLDPRIIAEWIGRARTERAPYEPPSEANLLSREEQDAINRLILLLAQSKKRGQDEQPAAVSEKMSSDTQVMGVVKSSRKRRTPQVPAPERQDTT